MFLEGNPRQGRLFVVLDFCFLIQFTELVSDIDLSKATELSSTIKFTYDSAKLYLCRFHQDRPEEIVVYKETCLSKLMF